MSQNYHTPIVNGDVRKNDASIWNDPLGELDSQIGTFQGQITQVEDALDAIVIESGTSDAETIAARTAIPYVAGSPPALLGETIGYMAGNVANVLAFGAVANGVTNDTAAVLAAVTNHEMVYFPPGTYVVNELEIPASRTLYALEGATLKTNTVGNSILNVAGDDVVIRNLTLQGTGASGSGVSIELETVDRQNVRVENVNFVSMGQALTVVASGTSRTLTNLWVTGCTFDDIETRAFNFTQGAGNVYTLEDVHIEGNRFVDIAEESSGGPFGGAIYIGGLTAVRRFYLCDNIVYRAAPQFLAMAASTNPRADFIIRGNVIRQEGTTSVIHMCYQLYGIDNVVFADNTCTYVEFEHVLISNCTNFKVSNSHFADANIGVGISDLTAGERSWGSITNCTFEDIECPTSENSGHKAIYFSSDGGRVNISNCNFIKRNGTKTQVGIDVAYANTGAKWARVFDSTNYTWVATTGSRYYLTRATTGDPGDGLPVSVYENDTALSAGTLATLTASQWAWGDGNTLGYNTIYVRLSDSTAPGNKEVSAGYGRFGINISNCNFERVQGIAVASGGSLSYPGHARVMNCHFVRCGTATNFAFALGNVISGCTFESCNIDIRTTGDTSGLRSVQNLHFNTNPADTATSGAYALSVSSGYSLWEISSCTFRNVNNIYIMSTGTLLERKRMFIFLNNDVDTLSTDAPSTTAAITAISNANKVIQHHSAAPASGPDYVTGDIIWNSDLSQGENIGWMARGAGASNISAVVAGVSYRTVTAAPAVNSLYIGEELLDTTNNKWYKAKATGTGGSDWVALN